MLGVRDLLFLNNGDATFREVGAEAGLEVVKFAHGLGVVLTDVDLDDDLDIYLANDTEPNRLYKNVAWPGGEKADPAGLGFRFEEVAAQAGVADPGAGMGVASGDYDGDVRPDLFVTNLREQGHGVFRTGDAELPPPSFTDERLVFGPDLFAGSGWGVSWADLDLDTDARRRPRQRPRAAHGPHRGRAGAGDVREPHRTGGGRASSPMRARARASLTSAS